jgi:hypothetical protein
MMVGRGLNRWRQGRLAANGDHLAGQEAEEERLPAFHARFESRQTPPEACGRREREGVVPMGLHLGDGQTQWIGQAQLLDWDKFHVDTQVRDESRQSVPRVRHGDGALQGQARVEAERSIGFLRWPCLFGRGSAAQRENQFQMGPNRPQIALPRGAMHGAQEARQLALGADEGRDGKAIRSIGPARFKGLAGERESG